MSSLLLKHCSRSLLKAMPRSERGREKAATFPLSPKWLRAGGKQLGAERKSRVLRPAQGRAGRFSRHLSPRFLLFNNTLCPISQLSVWTNDIQLCCQCTRDSTGPACRGKAASRLRLPHGPTAVRDGGVPITVSSC